MEVHQQRRGSMWTNYEAPLAPGNLPLESGTVLLDCLTMWATNILFDENEDLPRAIERFRIEWRTLADKPLDIIAVTNEIGLGGISANPLQRKFTDLQGMVNQIVAAEASEMYMLVSGVPLRIK